MGETQVVLDSSHVRVTYGTNQRQWGLQRTCPKYPNWPITAKRVIFKEKQKSWCIFLKFMWSSLCLIGFIRFKGTWPDMWGMQNTLSISHNHAKSVSKLPSPLKITLFGRCPAMWGVQNNLSLSLKTNLKKSVSRLASPLKIILFTFFALFWLFLHSWQLLWNLHCLWLVSSCP